MRHRKAWLLCASAFTVLGAHSAWAQTAPAPAQDSSTIEEVVVTAERVEGNVQTTPISIAVYSGETLEARGVANIRALSVIDTSINFSTSGGQNVISIRGVTSTNATETGEPAVSVSMDGVFNNRGYSLGATMYDIARVEVLRGPQGTLFGRNTTGGMLNIITQRPGNDFAGRITADFGNYGAKNFDGFLNVPVSDTVKMRTSFSSRYRDGFRKNTPFDQRADDEVNSSGRVQLAWEPSARLRTWLSLSATHEGGIGGSSESIPFRYAPGTPLNATGQPTTPGTPPLHTMPPLSDGVHYTIFSSADQKIDTRDAKWSLAYDLTDAVTLSYLGGYNTIDFMKQLPTFFRGNPSLFTRREKPDTWNNEVRIASHSGPLTWQAGAFAYSEKSGLFTDFIRNAGSATATELYQFDSPLVKATSKALFAQANYNITEALKITGGVRHTWDEKTRRGVFRIRPAYTGAPVTVTQTQDGDAKSDKTTWLVGLDYQVTARNLIYGKVSTGYKSGGFTGASQYKPETMVSYEVGTKNRFFDNSLQLNLAAYLMNYEDQQVNQYLAVGGGPVQAVTTNAGESEIYGLEANVISTSELGRFELSANLLHARYKTFVLGAGWSSPPAVTVLLDLEGNRLPVSPDFSVSLQWEKSFGVLGGSLTPRAAVKHQTKVYYAPNNYEDQKQGAFETVDVSATWEPAAGNWSVQAYANNLFDIDRIGYADENYNFGVYNVGYGPPRTYGVRISASF